MLLDIFLQYTLVRLRDRDKAKRGEPESSSALPQTRESVAENQSELQMRGEFHFNSAWFMRQVLSYFLLIATATSVFLPVWLLWLSAFPNFSILINVRLRLLRCGESSGEYESTRSDQWRDKASLLYRCKWSYQTRVQTYTLSIQSWCVNNFNSIMKRQQKSAGELKTELRDIKIRSKKRSILLNLKYFNVRNIMKEMQIKRSKPRNCYNQQQLAVVYDFHTISWRLTFFKPRLMSALHFHFRLLHASIFIFSNLLQKPEKGQFGRNSKFWRLMKQVR